MTDEQVHRRLSAALRAQASGLGSGVPPGAPAPPQAENQPAPQTPAPGHRAVAPRRRLSAWWLLGLAVALGGVAGALSGVISAW